MENGLDKLTSREILQMYTRVSEFITFLNKEEKKIQKKWGIKMNNLKEVNEQIEANKEILNTFPRNNAKNIKSMLNSNSRIQTNIYRCSKQAF